MSNQTATQPRKQVHGAGMVYGVIGGAVAWPCIAAIVHLIARCL